MDSATAFPHREIPSDFTPSVNTKDDCFLLGYFKQNVLFTYTRLLDAFILSD